MGLWVMQRYILRRGGSKLACHLRLPNPQIMPSLADRSITDAPKE
jgi:hypothetical protein